MMTHEEEVIINTKLMELIEKLNISEADFQKNTYYHSQDQHKVMQMQVQKQTMSDMECLTRDKCFEVFKVQQAIQIEHMMEMMKTGMNQNTPEGQMAMMMHAMI